MKKVIILLIALVAINIANAQGCLPEGIIFSTQEDIDNFQTNYPGCTEIVGSVLIQDNSIGINNLNGLSVLTSIGGSLTIHNFGYYSATQNLNGLDGLTSIGNDLYIYECVLVSLNGLESVTSIGGSLKIGLNTYLVDFTGLQNLISIGGSFEYWAGWMNNNISGFTNLSYIGGDFFIGQSPISSVVGFEALTTIMGSLQFNMIGLQNLSGLNGLTFIGGNIIFDGCFSLQDLQGLDNLTTLSGIYIYDCNMLQNLTGLEGVTSIVGPIWIEYAEALVNLTGLEGLTTIGGDLKLVSNYSLTNLTGLENLSSIGGFFIIGGNSLLANFMGLENLDSIASEIHINLNPNLTCLTGLDNIDASSISYLQITYNNLLSACDVQSICDYLAAPNGVIEINNNATGCNSPEEVEQHCLTPVEELETRNGITIIPNPSKDKITISSSAINGNTQLSIFNVSGEKVIERKLTDTETQIDISTLPRGVYFVRLQNEKMVEVGKMVKE